MCHQALYCLFKRSNVQSYKHSYVRAVLHLTSWLRSLLTVQRNGYFANQPNKQGMCPRKSHRNRDIEDTTQLFSYHRFKKV